MANELKANGISAGKVWNYAPSNLKPLTVATPNDPSGQVTWGYHVAPTVPVVGADGITRTMVIDPSISDGPITPDQWKALQGQPNSELVETSTDPYFRPRAGMADLSTPSDADIKKQFDLHRADREANWSGTAPR